MIIRKSTVWLGNIPLFQSLSNTQLAQVEGAMRRSRFEPKTRLVERGAIDRDLRVVLTGRVGLIDEGRSHRDWFTATLSPGQVFGEVGFLTGEPSTLSAVVGPEPTELLTLNRFAFDRLCDADPELGGRFYSTFLRVTAASLSRLQADVRNYILWGYRPPH